jgi:hypothetical protein
MALVSTVTLESAVSNRHHNAIYNGHCYMESIQSLGIIYSLL